MKKKRILIIFTIVGLTMVAGISFLYYQFVYSAKTNQTEKPSYNENDLIYYESAHGIKEGDILSITVKIPSEYMDKTVKFELYELQSKETQLLSEFKITKERISITEKINKTGQYVLNTVCEGKDISEKIQIEKFETDTFNPINEEPIRNLHFIQ